MGLSFNQGGTPMTGVSRANPFSGGVIGGKSFSVVGRIRWNSAPVITATAQCVWIANSGASSIALVWDGPNGRFLLSIATSGVNGQWTITPAAAPVSGQIFEFALTHTGSGIGAAADCKAYTLNNASASWSTNALLAAPATVALLAQGTGATSSFGGTFYAGSDPAAASGLVADTIDLAVFEGIITDGEITRFGKGIAPYQLRDSATLRFMPEEASADAYDWADATLLTRTGTLQVLTAADGAGPMTFEDYLSAASANLTTSLGLYRCAEYVVKDATNRILVRCDLSGGRGHWFATGTNRPLHKMINGRWHIVYDRRSSAKTGSTRTGTAGGPSGTVFPGAISCAWVGSINCPQGHTSGVIQLCWFDTNALANYFAFQANLATSIAQTYLLFNGSGPTGQTGKIFNGPNLQANICCWTGGAGPNNVVIRCAGVQQTYSYNFSTINRYPYGDGRCAETNSYEVVTEREVWAWTADKASVAGAIEAELNARNAVPCRTKGCVVLGASSEEGEAASENFYPRLARRLNHWAMKGFAEGGSNVWGIRLTGVTRTGAGSATAFTAGETVTMDGSAGAVNGKFLYEDPPEAGGQIALYDATGVFTALGASVTGVTSGATRTYAALPLNETTSARSLADTARITDVIAALNQYGGHRMLILNLAGNAFLSTHTPLTTTALLMGCQNALLARIRAGLTGTVPFRVIVREHQPTATGDPTRAAAWRNLLRVSQQSGGYRLARITRLFQFDDFAGATDYGNATYYPFDTSHVGANGQPLWVPDIERAGWTRMRRRRRHRLRARRG